MIEPLIVWIAVMAFLCGAITATLISLTIQAAREATRLSRHPGTDPTDLLDPHPPGPLATYPVGKAPASK